MEVHHQAQVQWFHVRQQILLTVSIYTSFLVLTLIFVICNSAHISTQLRCILLWTRLNFDCNCKHRPKSNAFSCWTQPPRLTVQPESCFNSKVRWTLDRLNKYEMNKYEMKWNDTFNNIRFANTKNTTVRDQYGNKNGTHNQYLYYFKSGPFTLDCIVHRPPFWKVPWFTSPIQWKHTSKSGPHLFLY